MLTIELSFPTGRYHATPWNRHVNEGEVEWPPSPWRILRALIASWNLKARDQIPADAFTDLIERMASELPRFVVPQSIVAHTRHYMPIPRDEGKTSKILDAFVRVPKGANLNIQWPDLALSNKASEHLAWLLERLNYLGRAESIVEARLVDGAGVGGRMGSWVVPDHEVSDANADQRAREDIVPLLAPLPQATLTSWRQGVIDQRLADTLRHKQAKKKNAKLSKKERSTIEDSVPIRVFDALTGETESMHQRGWTRPPGSRWVSYARDRSLIRTVSNARPRRARADRPTVARFAVTSGLAPRLTDGVFIAELMRQSLIKYSDGAPVFCGRDSERRLIRGHRHVYILPESHDPIGRITHITLYARMGFSATARSAIERVQRIWSKRETTTLVLLGMGDVDTFAGTAMEPGRCSLLVRSREWISRTPFVPTRHAKARRDGQPKLDESGSQIGSPEHDLRRLLRENGHPEPLSIQSVSERRLGGKMMRWTSYKTRRMNGGGARGAQAGHGFRLVFAEPIAGPLCLGYGAHLGLGMFEPTCD